ncbi:MAG: TM1812 family CRISPR-associated protein [Succinimonas sp.]|nr:TM1812 family CRISPR-associated protein [Succinimonas sp.]
MKDIDILVCALGNASYCAATYDFIDDCGDSPAPQQAGAAGRQPEVFSFSGSAVMARLIKQKCRPDIVVFTGTMQSNWRCAGSYLKQGFRNTAQNAAIPDTPLFSEDLNTAANEAKKHFPAGSSSEEDLGKLADALNRELGGKLTVTFIVIPRFLNTEHDKATFIRNIKEQVIGKTDSSRNLRFHIDMSNGLRFLPVLTFLSLECLRLLDRARISIKNIFCSEIAAPPRKIFPRDRYTMKLRSLCNLAARDAKANDDLNAVSELAKDLEKLARNLPPPPAAAPGKFNMRNLSLCDDLFRTTERLSTFRHSGELANLYPLLSSRRAGDIAEEGMFCESLGFYSRARDLFRDFQKAIASEKPDLRRLISERLSWCSGKDFDLKKLVKMYYGVNDYLHASLTAVRILEDAENQDKAFRIKMTLNAVNHLDSSEKESSRFLNSIENFISEQVPADETAHAGSSSGTLISFVGRDSYDLMEYRMKQDNGSEILLEPMKFAGAGLAGYLSGKGSLKRLVLCGTASSAWYLAAESLKECFKNKAGSFQDILDILGSYGDADPGNNGAVSEMPLEDQDTINELGKTVAQDLGFEFQVVLLNDLMEKPELIAEKIGAKIPENTSVFLDITHCYRYVPIIFSSVLFMLSYLRKNVQLRQIWYGDMGEPHPALRLSGNRLFQNEKALEQLTAPEDREKAGEILGKIRHILDPLPEDQGFLSGDLRSLSAVSAVLYDALDIAKFKETRDLICLERILKTDFANRPELAEQARQSSLYENLCCFRESYETGRDIIAFFRDPANEDNCPPFVKVLYRELSSYFRNIESNRLTGERTAFCIEKAKAALSRGSHRELVRALIFLYEGFKSIAEEVLHPDGSYDKRGSDIRNWYKNEHPNLKYEKDGFNERFYEFIALLRNGREHNKENEHYMSAVQKVRKTH